MVCKIKTYQLGYLRPTHFQLFEYDLGHSAEECIKNLRYSSIVNNDNQLFIKN